MAAYIIGWILTGLIVGALGRLFVPGPSPMGIGMTILVGIAGAILGGIIAVALGLGGLGSLIVAVAVTAGIVYLMQGRSHRRYYV